MLITDLNGLETHKKPTHFAIQSISTEVFGKLLHVAGEAPVGVHFWVQHLQKSTAQIIHALSVTYFCRDQRNKLMIELDIENANTVLHNLTTRCRPTSANTKQITNTTVKKLRSVRFHMIYCAQQGCIYFPKNTVKTAIFWNNITI